MTTRLGSLLVLVAFGVLTNACIGCNPFEEKFSGPGRMVGRHSLVKRATRVHAPAFTSKKSGSFLPSILHQGLNADGGRITVNLSGSTIDTLHFGLGPITYYHSFYNDAGVPTEEQWYADPPVILDIQNDGTATTRYTFDEGDRERFNAGSDILYYGQGYDAGPGADFKVPVNLALSNIADNSGNILSGSNGVGEILKIDADGGRSTFVLLEAPIGDLQMYEDRVYFSILPTFTIDTNDAVTLISPAKIASVNMQGEDLKAHGMIDSDLETLRLGIKKPVNDAEGHTLYYISTGIYKFARSPDALYVTDSSSNRVLKLDANGALTEFSTGLTGVTSISYCSKTGWFYATLPAVIHSEPGDLFSYAELPRVVAISPEGQWQLVMEFTEYANIDPMIAQNGVTWEDLVTRNRIAICQLFTIATDADCNLVIADQVRESIDFVEMSFTPEQAVGL